MSLSIVVKISESVSEVIHVDVGASDRITQKVKITPILEPAAIKSILIEVLKEEGWEEQDGTFQKKDEKGRKMEWNPDKMEMAEDGSSLNGEVTTTLALSKEVKDTIKQTQTERVVRVENDETISESERKEIKSKLRRKASKALDRNRDSEKERLRKEGEVVLQEEVREELVKGLADREELNKTVQKVYTKSLKEKARRMGNVTEIREDTAGGKYSLTIKIKE